MAQLILPGARIIAGLIPGADVPLQVSNALSLVFHVIDVRVTFPLIPITFIDFEDYHRENCGRTSKKLT